MLGWVALTGCSQRMGHNVEDLTSVSNGRFAGHIAAVDGYDVYVTPMSGPARAPKKAFDLTQTSITGGARGIAYIPEQRAFVFTNPRKPEYLLRTNAQGQELAPLSITYPEGFVHYHSEGLAYIPKRAPRFGGKLLMVAVQVEPEFAARLFVLSLQGEVEDEIELEGDVGQGWIASVAYDERGGFWLSQGDNKIHHFDFNGQKLEAPVEVSDAHSLEGIASTRRGGLFVGDLFDGTFRYLDRQRRRQTARDRSYDIGQGLTFPLGLAWRSDLKQLSVQHLSPTGFRFAGTPVELNAASEYFELEKDATYESSMTWIEKEGRYAVLRKSSGELWLVGPDGEIQDKLDLSEHMPIVAVDYLPSRGQFILLAGSKELGQELRLVTREGSAVGEFDLQALSGIDHAVSMASYEFQDQIGVVVAQTPEEGSAMVAFDLDGRRRWSLNYRETLGIVYPSNMTAIDMDIVPSFAVSDAGSSKIAVFSPTKR